MLTLEGAVIENGAFTLTANFIAAQGRIIAVIGPSGAGKSTLIGGIAGFHPIKTGRILWAGADITTLRPGQRRVSMLFQDNNLFPHLTVAENTGLGMRPDLKLDPAQRQKVSDALARVGLEGFETRKPAALSGGQQSRAALARILVQNKPLILLDEPFAALGPALRNEMLDLVAELVAETGAALIMVTHAPEDVRRIADQVVFVAEGRAEAPQPAAALMDNPPPALRAYLG